MNARPDQGIGVIGAGVIGLTTGLALKRKGYPVTIYAKSSSWRETASSAAAAFWYPFWTGGTVDHGWYKPEWARHTYYEFEKHVDSPSAGVSVAALKEYFTSDMTDREVEDIVSSMWWRS
ncbi:FAD-binding oxidoreductase [Candidatus Parcubacteria bacterium]|nr:FAD-binding oxidoreductase [Candidatus Parcubacteria bacterium]